MIEHVLKHSSKLLNVRHNRSLTQQTTFARSHIHSTDPLLHTHTHYVVKAMIATLYDRVCEAAVHEFLVRGVKIGSLTLDFGDGDEWLFGEIDSKAMSKGEPVTKIRVRNRAAFFARVSAGADIGFAEAYMAGDFDMEGHDALVNVFRLIICNRDEENLSTSRLVLSWLGAKVNRMFHTFNANTLEGSKRNIAAHYDLSNELFGTFLGNSWMYSCALFEREGMNLDEAQQAKIERVLELAKLEPGQQVLEIGSGWGELAIVAAKKYGVEVTGITLSEEQLLLATERARIAGVEGKVKFLKADYRNIPQGRQYDRIVSVEMMEAVGHEYLTSFFEKVDLALKDDGVVVVQVITTPEERYEVYRSTTDFIQKYIFPGGLCPSFEAVVSAAACSTSLSVEFATNIGVHYASTLREWRRRFCGAVKSGRVGELGFDEVFVRKWIYYLCYCEAGFATRTLGNMQIVFSRPRNVEALGVQPTCAHNDL